MTLLRRLTGLFAPIVLAACATVAPAPPAHKPFVVAANPLAAEAGMEVLRRGGSAVDAAIAVEAMLSLVEPQSSGLGGGAFITHYDSTSRRVSIYDGRETAPAQATASMFLGSDGKPLDFGEAVVSGRATGVPGVLAALQLAHSDHGHLPWASLVSAAQRTAADGFIVSPRLARMVAGKFPQNATPDVRAYFAQGPGGAMVKAGDRLRNPAYAEFLARLGRDGIAAMYAGETAARIVARTRAGPLGGSMTMADLAGYRALRREALCRPWRVYVACVPPPPSSGVATLMLLGLTERTDIASRGPGDPQAWFLFAEASRLMYADRDLYVGDPAFVRVPVDGLLDPAYLDSRARLIGRAAMPTPAAGVPAGAPVAARDGTREPIGTTHFIVGDSAGDVVSVTATVESIFGSGRMVDGMFLNNQLTDFSFDPRGEDGRPAANAVGPGKRPRSSMTPLILIDSNGRFAGAIGSAGGNAILAFVGKSLIAAVDWELPMQQALALPNLVARGGRFQGEVDKFPPALIAGLKARGVDLKPGQGEDSGVHGVMIREGGRIDGGFDPRREGVVLVGD
ncbi:MAG TPA: gamma-glutamyltransferase family protein [Sphingomicrobium sp.]|nr:gamma-glutamyltransferase family protein [Sphingomicrobium sp.]